MILCHRMVIRFVYIFRFGDGGRADRGDGAVG